MLKFLYFFIFSLLIQSCGPRTYTYKMKDYSDPVDDAQKTCFYQCQTIKNQCIQNDFLEADSYRKAGLRYIKPDNFGCKLSYDLCYENCGGKISTKTVKGEYPPIF